MQEGSTPTGCQSLLVQSRTLSFRDVEVARVLTMLIVGKRIRVTVVVRPQLCLEGVQIEEQVREAAWNALQGVCPSESQRIRKK